MKFFLFFFLSLFVSNSYASLDEVVISTENKDCSIHYLTTKTKFNWTIKVDSKNCQNGWVNGYASVQLFSAQKKQTETLTGFFNEGYWLASFPATGRIIERTSPEEKVQSLSFLLGKDEEANITYIGQLRAEQPEERAYNSFEGCPDFRVLIVVDEPYVFENKAFQDKIVTQGLKYAHQYCAEPDILALFGATTEKNPDIIFQMQVDTITGDRKIIPLSKKESSLKESLPIEIREEKTDILLSVEPKEDLPKVSYTFDKNPKKLNIPQNNQEKKKEILSHLQILSKTSNTPVVGRTVVHINQVLLDGTGITDLPEKVELIYHPNMKTGWALVEGVLSENKIRVSDIQFCKQEWCTDVP